jgi:hypothetical protein
MSFDKEKSARHSATRRARIKPWMVTGLCLTGLCTAATSQGMNEAPLPKLSVLPLKIIPGSLILAADAKTYELIVFNHTSSGNAWQTVGGSVFQANLASAVSDPAYQNASAFELYVVNWERSPTTKLRMVFEATTKRCLVSAIDTRLVHSFSAGREIRVSTVYYKDAKRLVRANTVKTFCTAFNGGLSIIFGWPIADMLQTMIVTYDNSGARAAVSQINLDFPTYAW